MLFRWSSLEERSANPEPLSPFERLGPEVARLLGVPERLNGIFVHGDDIGDEIGRLAMKSDDLLESRHVRERYSRNLINCWRTP